MVVRQLTQLEASTPELLPPELRAFQFPYLVHDWCWVVEHEGQPIALVVTSAVHGVLFIWRVLATASAKREHSTWFLVSIPQILENAKVRGCLGYGAFLHDDRECETQLARILQRNGATLEPWVGSVAIAPLFEEENA